MPQVNAIFYAPPVHCHYPNMEILGRNMFKMHLGIAATDTMRKCHKIAVAKIVNAYIKN